MPDSKPISERFTRETILASMMSNWDNRFDKRRDSLVYDACIAAANELDQGYLNLSDVEANQFPDTADRGHLLKWAREQSVPVRIATAAVLRGVFNAGSQVQIGSRFNQMDGNFIVIYQLTDPDTGIPIPNNFALQSENTGVKWNAYTGRLTPITSVPGLTSGMLTEVLIPGQDDEDTESIRRQVIASYNSRSFGGNRAQYIEYTEDLNGVGGAKAKRRVGSTVDVLIIASDFTAPSTELIEFVQTALDPVQNGGEGLGIAPFGHRVSVSGVTDETINISVEVELIDAWTWELIKPEIEAQILGYFNDLSKKWADADQTVVRIAELISKIVVLSGVVDVTDLLLNGSDSNIVLTELNIPALGELTQII